MAKNWYILHVYSGHENKVSGNIEHNLKRQEVGKYIGEVKIPIENTVELRNGKKQQVKKKFFPGYILVEMDLPDSQELWQSVCNAIIRLQSVTGFVGTSAKEKPVPIPKKEAQEILQRMGAIKTPATYVQKISFLEGELVRVKDGPFANFSGAIEYINHEKGKVRIKVDIFGRSTPIELDFYQVEAL